MPTFANYFDLDLGYLGHYGTFNNSDITLVKVRDIVVSVDFIDSFKNEMQEMKSSTRSGTSTTSPESTSTSTSTTHDGLIIEMLKNIAENINNLKREEQQPR
jgi:hypothetical protein